MKVIRYIDNNNQIKLAAANNDDEFYELSGDLFNHKITTKRAEIHKILAPIVPPIILCIGLNYRLHAKETNMPIPENPVLFIKGANAVQNPDDPIVLPRFLKSEQVDYECELAVVIGKE